MAAVKRGAQSCSADENGVIATITVRVAGADSSTDVDGVSTIIRGGVRSVATVDSGALEFSVGEIKAVSAQVALER